MSVEVTEEVGDLMVENGEQIRDLLVENDQQIRDLLVENGVSPEDHQKFLRDIQSEFDKTNEVSPKPQIVIEDQPSNYIDFQLSKRLGNPQTLQLGTFGRQSPALNPSPEFEFQSPHPLRTPNTDATISMDPMSNIKISESTFRDPASPAIYKNLSDELKQASFSPITGNPISK